MTELPPIIERLDAHLAEADTLGQRGHINASRDVLVNVARSDAPELRALVLRLQEEWDELQQAISQGGWKAIAETNSELADHWKQERDALLEALKRAKAIADVATTYPEDALREVSDTARSAIANVEGSINA